MRAGGGYALWSPPLPPPHRERPVTRHIPGHWTSCWVLPGGGGWAGEQRVRGQKWGGERRRRPTPNLGLQLSPAMGASLEKKEGDLGSWWKSGWGLRQGGASHLCLLCVLCVTSSPPQAPGAGPQFPFSSPKHLSLTIKFSIFGVFVSYFPGTERRSERDWKQPFVLRSFPSVPIPAS